MPDFARIYARQEYLTPGAADSVRIIAETMRPAADSLLVDIACGKGEAACTIAERTGCAVLAVDLFPPFLWESAAKAVKWGLSKRVRVVRADGRRLPLADASVDGGFCIGAPSIVGLEPCLAELARVVRPRGYVVVSDIVWGAKQASVAAEWQEIGEWPQVSKRDYRAALKGAGLQIKQIVRHDLTAWEAYFAPMLAVARDARGSGEAADVAFADEIEQSVALERRGAEELFDYVTFVTERL